MKRIITWSVQHQTKTIKQLQQATSTETEGSYLSEAREPPSITLQLLKIQLVLKLLVKILKVHVAFLRHLVTSSTNSNQSFTFSHDIQHLNEYLKIIGEREFSDDGRYQWDSYSKSAKSYYTKRFRNILTKLITSIFPEEC